MCLAISVYFPIWHWRWRDALLGDEGVENEKKRRGKGDDAELVTITKRNNANIRWIAIAMFVDNIATPFSPSPWKIFLASNDIFCKRIKCLMINITSFVPAASFDDLWSCALYHWCWLVKDDNMQDKRWRSMLKWPAFSQSLNILSLILPNIDYCTEPWALSLIM